MHSTVALPMPRCYLQGMVWLTRIQNSGARAALLASLSALATLFLSWALIWPDDVAAAVGTTAVLILGVQTLIAIAFTAARLAQSRSHDDQPHNSQRQSDSHSDQSHNDDDAHGFPATTRQRAIWSAAEASTFAAAGGAVGVGLYLLGNTDALPQWPRLIPVLLFVVIAAAVGAALSETRYARTVTRATSSLLVVLAVLALVRYLLGGESTLLELGSGLEASALGESSGSSTSLLTAATPALLIVAIAVVVTILFPLLARMVIPVARRAPGLTALATASTLARRPSRGLIALFSIAASTVVLAAGMSGTIHMHLPAEASAEDIVLTQTVDQTLNLLILTATASVLLAGGTVVASRGRWPWERHRIGGGIIDCSREDEAEETAGSLQREEFTAVNVLGEESIAALERRAVVVGSAADSGLGSPTNGPGSPTNPFVIFEPAVDADAASIEESRRRLASPAVASQPGRTTVECKICVAPAPWQPDRMRGRGGVDLSETLIRVHPRGFDDVGNLHPGHPAPVEDDVIATDSRTGFPSPAARAMLWILGGARDGAGALVTTIALAGSILGGVFGILVAAVTVPNVVATVISSGIPGTMATSGFPVALAWDLGLLAGLFAVLGAMIVVASLVSRSWTSPRSARVGRKER